MNKARKVPRRKVRRDVAILVGARVSRIIVEAVDRAAGEVNCDRSNFLRCALEEKIARREREVGGESA
jgi:hypothetical protein